MKLSDYTYRYSAAAHLAACDKYPDGLTNVALKQSADGFDAVCWGLSTLATQGELMRRYMGMEPHEMLTAEKVQMELMPYQLPEAKVIILNAVMKGLDPKGDENAEVDVVLQELQKKTVKKSRKASTSA